MGTSLFWKLALYTLCGAAIIVLPYPLSLVQEPGWLELIASVTIALIEIASWVTVAVTYASGPRYRPFLIAGFIAAALAWLAYLQTDIEEAYFLVRAMVASLLFAGPAIGGLCIVVSGILFIINQFRLQQPADDGAALL